jgi:hypothetical protein
MTQWWLALWWRGAKRVRALRTHLRVELLEARNVLTNSLVFVPSPILPRSELFGAAAIAANDMWAVGYTGAYSVRPPRPVVEHFDGTKWSVVPNSLPNDPLVSVAAVASNDVWAVGTPRCDRDSPSPFIAHWDGRRWSVVSVPNPNPGAIYYDITFSGIAAIAANDIRAVGSFPTWPNGNYEHALTEHWGGTRWSIIPSPTSGGLDFLHAVAARSDGTVVAVGSQGNVVPLIYQNAASAPKAARTAAAPLTTMPEPLPLARHNPRARQEAANADLDGVSEDLWLWA